MKTCSALTYSNIIFNYGEVARTAIQIVAEIVQDFRECEVVL